MVRSLFNIGCLDRFVIVVIDLGIIYLGYVYIFKYEFERECLVKDMCKVFLNNWQLGSLVGLILYKIFISLFFIKDGEFDLFGYKVEKNYMDFVNGNKYIGWCFY